MIKRVLILPLALVTLTAGQCRHTEPAVEIRTVEVPTPVPCPSPEVAAAIEAAEPDKVSGQLTGDANADLAIVAANSIELRAWGLDLLAIVKGCAE